MENNCLHASDVATSGDIKTVKKACINLCKLDKVINLPKRYFPEAASLNVSVLCVVALTAEIPSSESLSIYQNV